MSKSDLFSLIAVASTRPSALKQIAETELPPRPICAIPGNPPSDWAGFDEGGSSTERINLPSETFHSVTSVPERVVTATVRPSLLNTTSLTFGGIKALLDGTF